MNDSYKHKIFYNSKPVIPSLKEFKKEVIERSYNIQLEQKYKNDVNHREPTSKSLEWILNRCVKEENIIITDVPKNFPIEVDKFQVIFFVDWYFAWCDMVPKHKDYFVKKYGLNRRD